MKLGLIGDPLGHSKSAEIHKFLSGAEYSLWPLKKDQLDGFFKERNFDGLNVTIPYKTYVMKYLDEVCPDAEEAGAVNTIVNRSGKLYGYNTDITGLKNMLECLKTPIRKARTAILGSGGAARAALKAVSDLGGVPVIVSRDPEDTVKRKNLPTGTRIIGYSALYDQSEGFSVLINATPLGMAPDIDALPADLSRIPTLWAAADVVANPVRTRLMLQAQQLGLEAAGGIRMLVTQAFAADELFYGKHLDESLIDRCEAHIRSQMQNIVLIGMPSCGKTTTGSLLAQKLGMPYIDTDGIITSRIKMPIAEYFKTSGEAAFREKESELAAELALQNGAVIATGGGIVKNCENMRLLAHNGIIVWLDRNLKLLHASPETPLSQNAEDMKKLFTERLPLYEKYSDLRVKADGSSDEAAEEIIRQLKYQTGQR